jgi:glycosyltransferase involved in cell wall biosynthesis
MMRWHIITPEYPPQFGGVSDYTYLVAKGLSAAGDEVHVWCRKNEDRTANVRVHSGGAFSGAELWRMDRKLSMFSSPRRLLIQWVPHGYGYRSMNVLFCLWVWKRATISRDWIELMVHEPYLMFRGGSWKQNAVAIIHRLMMVLLTSASQRAWLAIPAWRERVQAYSFCSRLSFEWLPVASNIPVMDRSASRITEIRTHYAADRRFVMGHFGTNSREARALLIKIIPAVLRGNVNSTMLFIGRDSGAFREQIIRLAPELTQQVHATGLLEAADLSVHLSACDLMILPYVDGVSSRRSTAMAAIAHGIPVVTTFGLPTEPVWSSSRAVVLTPAGDSNAFVQATLRLVLDQAERERLSEASKRLYADHFDINHTISRLRAFGPTLINEGQFQDGTCQHN